MWANFRASLVWLAVNVNISCLTDSKEIQALLRGRREPNHLRFPTNAVLLPRHSIGREGTMRFHVGRMTVTCRVVLTSCKPEYQLIKKEKPFFGTSSKKGIHHNLTSVLYSML